MKLIKIIIAFSVCGMISNCGKIGPLTLPEEKLDKSVITYPCDEVCKKRFEEEKQRQQSVILQVD